MTECFRIVKADVITIVNDKGRVSTLSSFEYELGNECGLKNDIKLQGRRQFLQENCLKNTLANYEEKDWPIELLADIHRMRKKGVSDEQLKEQLPNSFPLFEKYMESERKVAKVISGFKKGVSYIDQLKAIVYADINLSDVAVASSGQKTKKKGLK